MASLLSTLPTLCTLPQQRRSAVQRQFSQLLIQNDFSTISQLYLQSTVSQRQELLENIEKTGEYLGFVNYLQDHPEHYLSHFFIAVMHSYSAREALHLSKQSVQNYQQIGHMIYYAQSAYELYLKTLPDSDKDVLVYSHLIDNLLFLHEDNETCMRYYQHALYWDKHNFQLHQAIINLLGQKGFNGRKQAFALAEKITANAAAGDPNLHLLALAHIQEWLFLGTQNPKSLQKNYFKRTAVAIAIKHAYLLFIKQRNQHSNNRQASQSFMFCFYMSGDLVNLRRELAFNKNHINFANAPWHYLNNLPVHYQKILQQCNLLTASKRTARIQPVLENGSNKQSATQQFQVL